MNMLSVGPLLFLMLQVGVVLQQPRARGSIEGTVTRQGSNQPVPNARVTLASLGEPSPTGGRGGRGAPAPLATATTDDKGQFAVRGIDEGLYTIQVEAEGYLPQTHGRRFAGGSAAPVAVTGQQPVVNNVAVSLIPAGNISGRIRDTSGQLLVNAPVQLLRWTYTFNGQGAFERLPATQTNDRGEYRLYWVKPGRYYLAAGRPSTGGPATPQASRNNLVPRGLSFYPGGDFSSAVAIDLRSGADMQGVDMTLAEAPRGYGIRGKLIDTRTGQPPTRPDFSVELQTPGFTQSGLAITDVRYNVSTGAFESRDLSPGTYTITAVFPDDPPPGWVGIPPLAMATLSVTVVDSDLDDVGLAAVPAGIIPGRVSVEGPLPAGVGIEGLWIQIEPVGSSRETIEPTYVRMGQGGIQGAPTSADGAFRIVNVAEGEYRIGLGDARAGAGRLFIKEARFEGADLLSNPMRYSAPGSGVLDIVVAVGSGQVQGVVSDALSQPVAGALVVLAPDRERHRADLYRMTYAAPNGQFVLTGIAPGDYKMFSFESVEENAWLVPTVLAQFETRGRSVRVAASSTETMDISVIPAEAVQ